IGNRYTLVTGTETYHRAFAQRVPPRGIQIVGAVSRCDDEPHIPVRNMPGHQPVHMDDVQPMPRLLHYTEDFVTKDKAAAKAPEKAAKARRKRCSQFFFCSENLRVGNRTEESARHAIPRLDQSSDVGSQGSAIVHGPKVLLKFTSFSATLRVD